MKDYITEAYVNCGMQIVISTKEGYNYSTGGTEVIRFTDDNVLIRDYAGNKILLEYDFSHDIPSIQSRFYYDYDE